MTIAIRWIAAMGLACLTTLVLFYFMQVLISTGQELNNRLNIIKIIDASMPEIELEILKEIEPPELIEEISEPPPDVPNKTIDMDSGLSLNLSKEVAGLEIELDLGSAVIGLTDGEMLPLINVSPQYPSRALQREIEGWCIVRFTVSGIGDVIEDSIVVEDSEPAGIFDRSCKKAAVRFKFRPRVVNGQGIAVPDVPYIFRFILEDR